MEKEINTALIKSKRLTRLIVKFDNGVKSRFAERLGITKQSLNHWLKNGFIDYEKVFTSCPGVSAEWLLTGKGPMMVGKIEEPKPVRFSSFDVCFCPMVNVKFPVKDPHNLTEEEEEKIIDLAIAKVGNLFNDVITGENLESIKLYEEVCDPD